MPISTLPVLVMDSFQLAPEGINNLSLYLPHWFFFCLFVYFCLVFCLVLVWFFVLVVFGGRVLIP